MTRHSEEHLNRVTESRFNAAMCKAFPILRGFKQKLRQGKQPIRPARFEEIEAKREARKEQRKKAKAKTAEVAAKTRRPKKRVNRWWI